MLSAGSDRSVRVFVSSTFRDMQDEREELVKRAFPRLRKLCEARGVTWGEVDLRWGITDEQRAEGRVLPICLEEIERCRPYFIGLLGERYGWVPTRIEPNLIERQPWLSEHAERSVTELEIVHGVLRHPEMANRSFFYLRDPAYVDSLPEERQREHRELPSAEELRRLGEEEAERRAEDRRRKLALLKERIRLSRHPVREYPDPRALGALVLHDLARMIDELFPEGSEPDLLAREAREHEAFARAHADDYIGRPTYFERLDAHAAGHATPLVVLGESGVGKSALLANWALRYRASHPDQLVLVHFVGSSAQSADWAAMLRRIMGELAARFGIERQIPEGPAELRGAFANWLQMAATRGRTVLILDALNQLEDRNGAPDLAWLPPVIPASVRLIVSTLAGRPLKALEERRWLREPLRVEPLTDEERRRLIDEYLARYTKALRRDQIKAIADAPQSANPLYLRTVLEELRLWGQHEKLDERIAHYLASPTIDDLYNRILERYEHDYDRERPGLVREAMSLLWATRRGLSEAELLDLLGSDGEPLPSAQWSPLHLAAGRSLTNRDGLIGFSHDYLRRAIRDRYLMTEEARDAAHLRLADYFDPRRDTRRGLDELPWQLAESSSWQRLRDLLADPSFLQRAIEANRFEVMTHWARIERHSPLRLVDAYRPLAEDPARHSARASMVCDLLISTGHRTEALPLASALVEHYRRTGPDSDLARALGVQAGILHGRGELDQAMALAREAEEIYRASDDWRGVGRALGVQAGILHGRGELDQALRLYRRQERLCRGQGDREGLRDALDNQAVLLSEQGEFDRAMQLHTEAARICRDLGDLVGLIASLDNQAVILQHLGEFDHALELHQEEERIRRTVGDQPGVALALGNQAHILALRGELDRAMALLERTEQILVRTGDRHGLVGLLHSRALILRDQRKFDEALAVHGKQEEISRELEYSQGRVISLVGRGVVLAEMGRVRDAARLFIDAHGVATRHGHTDLVDMIEQYLRRIGET